MTELAHRDKKGILDRYIYTYDHVGNKTEITKACKKLDKESGTDYQYNALNQLINLTDQSQEGTSRETSHLDIQDTKETALPELTMRRRENITQEQAGLQGRM